jgi:oxygen-independent coproporphyrinogen-3 oxidase
MWPYYSDLLDRAVPRYTSYPTAAEFTEGMPEEQYLSRLDGVDPGRPISLYVHIPYCREICWYCGCNTGAAGRAGRLEAYLDALGAETDLVSARLHEGTKIARIAFGGGSPNAISPLQFIRLVDRLVTRFRASSPLLSLELDPRGLDANWGHAIAGLGVARASLGVQTFAPHVQSAIGRHQPFAMIENAVSLLRRSGVNSLGFDLMYGLPSQSRADLAETIDRALTLSPDRFSIFGYAHLPASIPRQRRIAIDTLPDSKERFEQAMLADQALIGAGYVRVGFDHYAKPHDPLARAVQAGRLRRNFQGFTDDDCDVLIGLGASGISSFPDLLAQNEKNAGRYRMLVADGRTAVRSGLRRGPEDARRGRLIERILCDGAVALPMEISAAIGPSLNVFVERGLATHGGNFVTLTEQGRPYARALAYLLDDYRDEGKGAFSKAV